ncbi:MAG: TonB-dependent receptor [Gammaproteobacteria bacterium]|nr:TonB-dependent receptor [Gammaproteobacteria bacterium]
MLVRKLVFIFSSITSGLFIPGQAQEPTQTETLEELIVVANRIPQPIRQIGTSVSVLTEDMLKAHGNFSLANILRQSPAITVTTNGGMGATSALRIRGEEGFRTLTLIDGLKISDPSAPQVSTPFEHILSSGVSRVEILRGPQGLSYGADAGGVISINSKPTDPGVSVILDGQSGSRSTELGNLHLAAANESIDFSLSATEFETDGYNVRASDTLLADDDGYENSTVHARLGTNLSENFRLQLVHRNVEGKTQYDGCFAGTTAYDCDSLYELEATRLSLDYSSSSFSHSLAYSESRTERDDFALGSLSFGSSGELNRIEYVGSATNLPGFDLVYGVDFEEEANGSLKRDNDGAYLEFLSDFSDNFFVTAGVRRDENDDFGSHSSYRISTAYLFTLDASVIKLKGSYGSGFRAPSLFEIDYNAGPFAFPPAAGLLLSEEQSAGFEYGIEYRAGTIRLEVVRFDQEVEDALFFDLVGFSGYLQDSGTSASDGIEFSGTITVSEFLNFSTNYTHNETERPNDMQRLRRPEQLANFGINFTSSSEKFRLSAFYRVSRDSVDEQFGSRVDLDDFEVLDISASYRISENISLYARLENALDETYQEVLDFISPDRASYIGIRLNF